MRKSIFRILASSITAVVFLSAGVFGQGAERVFSLEQSLSAGMNNNQEILSLKEGVLIAQQTINEAQAQILPKIDYNFNASKFDNDVPDILGKSLGFGYLPAENRNQYYLTGFSLWQYLYAGGRYKTNLQLAQINMSQAQSRLEAAKLRVTMDIKDAFNSYLITRSKIEVVEKSVKELREPLELLKAESQLRELKHELAKNELKFLETTGLELDTPVKITGELIPPTQDYDVNICLAWAFQYRPELKVTQFQETIDSLQVNLSIIERYPTVTLGADYEWIGDQWPLDRHNWNATLNLNLPIFDGLASWAKIKQKQSQARQGKIERSRIQDKIRLEVRESFLDYSFWKTQAQELKEKSVTYKTPSDRREAQILWLEALEKALVSETSLEWAIGKSLEDQ
jgi:outer membrane protein